MDLVEILKRPEGKTLEFNRDLPSPDGTLKTIVAFANTSGGTLLIGAEDRTHHVRGAPDALGEAQGLAMSEIAPVIDLSPRATRTRLARLVDCGMAREIASGPQDLRRRYLLAERVPA